MGNLVSAPYCGKLLADLGAEVIKVEPPVTGDISRRLGPFANGQPHPEHSGMLLFTNLNKRSVTLNLDDVVGAWARQFSAEEAVEALQRHGVAAVAAMRVMNIEDQLTDPHLQEREAYVEIEHPHVGIEWLFGMPWLLSDTPGSVRTPVPSLGAHNEYVLCQTLDLPRRNWNDFKLHR